jgi:hypothetical protein
MPWLLLSATALGQNGPRRAQPHWAPSRCGGHRLPIAVSRADATVCNTMAIPTQRHAAGPAAIPMQRHAAGRRLSPLRRPPSRSDLGESKSRRNLLGHRRRANDGVAVHMHALGNHADGVLICDCRFLSQTRRLADAASSTAGCRPRRRSALARVQLAPAPPSAEKQDPRTDRSGRLTAGNAASLASGDMRVDRGHPARHPLSRFRATLGR